MVERSEITVLSSADALAEQAAQHLLECAGAAQRARGRFVVALSGGSTPRRLYRLLTDDAWRARFDWSVWNVFWSDERVVPLDDPTSNGGDAKRLLLDQVPVPTEQVHYAPTQAGSAAEPWPRFDLIFLGMGSDGHTASLFPGMPTLDERTQLVVASPPGVLPPPVDRVTFTLPVLNAARSVIFLVAGDDKRPALTRVVQGDRELPAARVRPTDGELHWLVDEAAAPVGANA